MTERKKERSKNSKWMNSTWTSGNTRPVMQRGPIRLWRLAYKEANYPRLFQTLNATIFALRYQRQDGPGGSAVVQYHETQTVGSAACRLCPLTLMQPFFFSRRGVHWGKEASVQMSPLNGCFDSGSWLRPQYRSPLKLLGARTLAGTPGSSRYSAKTLMLRGNANLNKPLVDRSLCCSSKTQTPGELPGCCCGRQREGFREARHWGALAGGFSHIVHLIVHLSAPRGAVELQTV